MGGATPARGGGSPVWWLVLPVGDNSRSRPRQGGPTYRGWCNVGIEKKIYLHKLRHNDTTHLLNAGAERVDIQAPLGHSMNNTPQIDTHVGQERMEQGVARL